jgi:hypothetical protein
VAATILEESEDMGVKFKGWLVVNGELMSLTERTWTYAALTKEDISLYILNAAIRQIRRLSMDKKGPSSLTMDKPMWTNVQSVPTPANTPRKHHPANAASI